MNTSTIKPGSIYLALVVLVAFWPSSEGQIRSPLYANELEVLEVQTAIGITAHFQVVTVTTPAEQAQGLMHIRHLAVNQGMLFSYSRSRILSMWMKNTYVPLDMWFVDANGQIKSVVTHTVPQSLESVKSDSPGAVIKHRVFRNDH